MNKIQPGDFAILLAEPWEEYIRKQDLLNKKPFDGDPFDRFDLYKKGMSFGVRKSLRLRLEEMIWWGYRVESINGNRAVIQSMTAIVPIRDTVPIECLAKVEKKAETKAEQPKVVREIPDP